MDEKQVIQDFTDKNLKNKNGKIEGQRINKGWFKKHKFGNEYEVFQKNSIIDSKTLYLFLTKESDKCSCGKEKRFVGFRDGFKEYCLPCSRKKNNGMLHLIEQDVQIPDVPKFVKDRNGGYSTTKLKTLSKDTVSKIKERTLYLKKASLSERIYQIEHNLFCLPKCKLCNKEHNNFYTSKYGYRDYCKGKCSYNYNRKEKIKSLRKHFYKKYQNLYQSTEDYNITLFTKENYLNNKECTIKFEHVCGHVYNLDKEYQGHLKCPKCFPVRSKIQYEIYDWLKDYVDCKFNDRKTIKPKELDIVCENFAIEYDGQMFHSYGKSSYNLFDRTIENKNLHLEKTELVESEGLQLFRIFSSEWVNKQEIWKSVLLSKIGKTKRIFARKCTIKEITSKVAKEFLQKNHLQGAINSSVRIGLFYNDELVSLMTFGKTRRAKYKGLGNFELYRFCTIINTTVVGGASRLLKYFEEKYTPKMIVSYANRRWSQGNLYDVLNFEFIENTKPNYFYFSGNDSTKLLSREQFQKHKLGGVLKNFDFELTETQNMYNNNYRKIYDCGNKVYIKK